MTESTFNPNHLMSLLPSVVTDSVYCYPPASPQDYEAVCNYCGVDWASRSIRVPADDFYESLNKDQVKSLRTFQDNLLHFFEHFDTVIRSAAVKQAIGFNTFESVLFNRIGKDLEEKGWLVFVKMTRNFIDQLRQHSTDTKDSRSSNNNNNNSNTNTQQRESQSFNDVIVDNLCDGDLEKALKLVPSRELARQLGVSDQKLRREIYLARQRALNKRPVPKKSSDDASFDDAIPIFAGSVNMPSFMSDINIPTTCAIIPTCASPLSSTSSSDFDLENSHFQLIESPLEGWQSWLNIDMIEL